MSRRLIDLAGHRVGSWYVLAIHPERKKAHVLWLCRCDCGTESLVRAKDLRRSASTHCRSCRGKMRIKHGHSRRGKITRAYACWLAMLRRCFNPNTIRYADYGGRGITVCERWRASFGSFYADMNDPPPGKSLDRINNGGDYEPSNCRWATASEQACNRRCSKRSIKEEK